MKATYHFIGIGGIGMSGLARILLEQEVSVSGSDLAQSALTEFLAQKGAKIAIGHAENHVSPDMTVVYSTDIKIENPEWQASERYRCKRLHRSELLANLMHAQKGLAVTGTHGKTTTSSLLSWVLSQAGLDPSFCIGGILQPFQTNGKKGEGAYFVAEADESDGSFLNYTPFGAIVTNIGLDHMNHFVTEEALIKAFKTFLSQVKSTEHLFWCGDDSRLRSIQKVGVSYGFDKRCSLRGSSFKQKGWGISFDVSFEGEIFSQVEVALTGYHNALNAMAVLGMALRVGIPEEVIRKAFKEFGGVGRRCEKKGEKANILFLDDYGHHPTEIAATVQAIRDAIGKRRLVVLFQPHRYSRTHDCLGQYGSLFDHADLVVVTDVYGAGEIPVTGVSGEVILQEIKNESSTESCFISRDLLLEKVPHMLIEGDVVVTMGAGDICRLGPQILEKLP